jgi:hypothetical protein
MDLKMILLEEIFNDAINAIANYVLENKKYLEGTLKKVSIKQFMHRYFMSATETKNIKKIKENIEKAHDIFVKVDYDAKQIGPYAKTEKTRFGNIYFVVVPDLETFDLKNTLKHELAHVINNLEKGDHNTNIKTENRYIEIERKLKEKRSGKIAKYREREAELQAIIDKGGEEGMKAFKELDDMMKENPEFVPFDEIRKAGKLDKIAREGYKLFDKSYGKRIEELERRYAKLPKAAQKISFPFFKEKELRMRYKEHAVVDLEIEEKLVKLKEFKLENPNEKIKTFEQVIKIMNSGRISKKYEHNPDYEETMKAYNKAIKGDKTAKQYIIDYKNRLRKRLSREKLLDFYVDGLR